MIEPNDVVVSLTAFTGVAAFNIDGITLPATWMWQIWWTSTT